MRPVVFVGPSLKSSQLTELLQKALVSFMKEQFAGRLVTIKPEYSMATVTQEEGIVIAGLILLWRTILLHIHSHIHIIHTHIHSRTHTRTHTHTHTSYTHIHSRTHTSCTHTHTHHTHTHTHREGGGVSGVSSWYLSQSRVPRLGCQLPF